MTEKDLPNNFEKRISILEFFSVFILSLFLTFIYAITQIFHISWYPVGLIYLWIRFFSGTFLTLYFILFLVNTIKKVGPTFSSLKSQWKLKSLLDKILITLGIPGSIITFFNLVKWGADLILHLNIFK